MPVIQGHVALTIAIFNKLIDSHNVALYGLKIKAHRATYIISYVNE